MKSMKMAIVSILMACSMSAFAANGAFISNQYPLDDTTLSGSDRVNPKQVLYVDEVYPNINIKLVSGATKVWSFTNATAYWAVMDRFVTGARSSGYDFLYAQTGSQKRRVGYALIKSLGCSVAGGNYTGSVEFTTTETITFTNVNKEMCTGGD